MQQYNDEIQLKDILIKLSEYKAYLLKKKFAIIAFSVLFSLIGIIIVIGFKIFFKNIKVGHAYNGL